MKGTQKLDSLGVMVDMAGCPNRCRHCWLGTHSDGAMTVQDFRDIAAEFKNWRDETGEGIAELGFFSWWREPDYRDDYRALWALEQTLSSPGRAQRFELLSTWRLARDPDYALWAATLPPRSCQISFFGMEENTDWFMRRKGAFRDQLLATQRLLEVGVAPRWQLFVTKRCLGELDEFYRLMQELMLHKRCEAMGRKFEVFIGGMSPEGSGFEVEDIRLEAADVAEIPDQLVSICREGLQLLGSPECDLLEKMLEESAAPNMRAAMGCVAIDADYDVYPNIAEPTGWWRLGNLKTDGVGKILTVYREETTPGMIANTTIPVAELARQFGDPSSTRLYDRSDLISRFLHQCGMGAARWVIPQSATE